MSLKYAKQSIALHKFFSELPQNPSQYQRIQSMNTREMVKYILTLEPFIDMKPSAQMIVMIANDNKIKWCKNGKTGKAKKVSTPSNTLHNKLNCLARVLLNLHEYLELKDPDLYKGNVISEKQIQSLLAMREGRSKDVDFTAE
jgi:hypothetical protein